jgi:hypothetical protein
VILLAGSVLVALPLRAQVIETAPGTTAQTSTVNAPENETVAGEGALIFSPAAAPLPADLTPTGGGLITQLFGPNKGPFQYAIHLTIRGAYDDNIALTHTNRLDDWFVEIQPSVLLGLGDLVKQETFLAAIYLPSFYRYDDHSEFDSDQHIVHVLGGVTAGNLILRLSQDVAIRKNIVLAGTSAERSGLGTMTGRTDLNTYNTRLSLNYNMTPRDFIFSELVMNRTDYAAPLIDSELYAVDFPTPDQQFVQANAHLNFTPNKQFSVDVIAGEEFRTFNNFARERYRRPVFVISAGFAPNDDLKFGLTATRQIYNSAAATAQDYVDTSVNGLMRAHICKPLYFTLLGGYEHVEYFNAIDLPMPLPTLKDDYFYIQPAIDLVLTRFWIIGGYYLRRQNSGSVSTVDFHANEFGVRTTIKF